MLDRLVEQPIEIELGAQVQEHRAQADGGAIHKNELARHRHRALLLERLVHPERFAPAVFRRRHAVGDGPYAVVEERPIDKARPDVERVDQIAGKPAKAPGLVRPHDQILVAMQEAVIEIDTPRTNFGGKIRMQP